jgi:alpha-L-fucosidase
MITHFRFALISLIICLLGCSFLTTAQAEEPQLNANQEDMQWFRDAKFGLFVHWGPVSLKGTEIGWSRGGERKYPKGKGEIPVEVYDNLYKKFNPVKFNADEWVAIAKATGMKYLVFTSKHHDGFCMFDSQYTDYKITNSPFKRDILKELADACHKAGIKLGFYHSQPDWRHDDYFSENHDRYIKYLHNLVRELCTNYGKLSIMWFDGLGAKPDKWNAKELLPMIYKLQPGIIINNRAGLPADFDTPEQRVGHFQNDRAWETCMTICHQWAWKPNDRLKTLKECIDILVRSVGGDGNLLLNVGPMPNGEIEARQVERLKEIGDWLKKYGDTIYSTRGGPFKTGEWGGSTYSGNNIYLHIVNWGDKSTFMLPKIDKEIISCKALTGGKATMRQTDKGIEISLPRNNIDDLDTIIALQLDGPAAEIKAINLQQFDSLAAQKEAQASNVYQNNTWAFGPKKAFDNDLSTQWASDSGIEKAWISVDLDKEAKFNRIAIRESYNRIQQFELQYKKNDKWITFHKGGKIGDKLNVSFKPIKAQIIRLNILKTTDGPSIREFYVFAIE